MACLCYYKLLKIAVPEPDCNLKLGYGLLESAKLNFKKINRSVKKSNWAEDKKLSFHGELESAWATLKNPERELKYRRNKGTSKHNCAILTEIIREAKELAGLGDTLPPTPPQCTQEAEGQDNPTEIDRSGPAKKARKPRILIKPKWVKAGHRENIVSINKWQKRPSGVVFYATFQHDIVESIGWDDLKAHYEPALNGFLTGLRKLTPKSFSSLIKHIPEAASMAF